MTPDSALDADFASAAPHCLDFYDVDDYARDWADWVGIAELPGAVLGGTTGRVSDQLLPTIFTIGFGLNYNEGTVTCSNDNCIRGLEAAASSDTGNLMRDRNADYLGEELLRYIADVGDNFQIDSDYWQMCASQTIKPFDPLFVPQTAPCLLSGFNNTENRIDNEIYLNNLSPEWGVRGPCEAAWTGAANARGNTFLPTTPQTSCGNYFVADNNAELQEVFNQIASRMFTRLSQ